MSLRWTDEDYQEWLRKQKTPHPPDTQTPSNQGEGLTGRRKYGNTPTEVDGIEFDSKHEAEVYQALMLRKQAGELKAVLRQVRFDLPGKIRYYADFLTVDADNRATVYDAKSEATRQNRVYINKKKQVKALYGLDIVEV